MNSRVQELESNFRATGRSLLMCALVAGDPHVGATLKYMRILADAGVDIIELVVPFSDPTYHGPVIQRACARAIHEDVNWAEIGELVAEFREEYETPLVVSSYYNRFLARGLEACAQDMSEAGVDGVLITDLAWDESAEAENAFAAEGIALIRAVAPSTPIGRFRKIVKDARGFVVWTGHLGGDVTVAHDEFVRTMDQLRENTSLPIIVSMKVSTGDDATTIGLHADGVLVRTALVWLIEGRGPDLSDRIRRFIEELRSTTAALK